MLELIKKNYKKTIVLIIVFIIFSFWCVFINEVTGDEVWNYGFAHNMYKGLIPYKDFNMVLTPLFPFLMSLPFHIFGSSIFLFNIEQAIIFTIITYLMYKKLKNKTWLLLLLLILPLPLVLPSYNMFIFLICLILINLEEKKANDYLIGIVLALGVLTKQSVGVCLILPSLIYIKQPKKILKRLGGFMIPMSIFLIYLICSKSLNGFIDLCFLGLFDFSDKNGGYLNFSFFFIIILLVALIVLIRRDPKRISNYYSLAFLSMAIPIFDLYHTQMAFLMFGYNWLSTFDHNFKINIKLFSIVLLIAISAFWGYANFSESHIYPNKLKHFEYRLVRDDVIKFNREITDFIKKNDDKEIVFFCSEAYYIKIVNDMDITWLDLVNDGNWGYHSEEKIINAIKKKKDAIYIVNEKERCKTCQMNHEAINYIIKNGQKVGSLAIYDVYIFE